jgi:hypothetical protein
MTAAGFEPTVPAIEQLQTYALDRTATLIGTNRSLVCHYYSHAHSQTARRKEDTASDTHGGSKVPYELRAEILLQKPF